MKSLITNGQSIKITKETRSKLWHVQHLQTSAFRGIGWIRIPQWRSGLHHSHNNLYCYIYEHLLRYLSEDLNHIEDNSLRVNRTLRFRYPKDSLSFRSGHHRYRPQWSDNKVLQYCVLQQNSVPQSHKICQLRPTWAL